MIAVAVAIYLVDCVVLLERGQALWSRAGLSFGSLHYQVRGSAVALLNPLTPFVQVPDAPLVFRIGSRAMRRALRRVAGALQLLLVLGALPYCLYRAPGWPFFAALCSPTRTRSPCSV